MVAHYQRPLLFDVQFLKDVFFSKLNLILQLFIYLNAAAKKLQFAVFNDLPRHIERFPFNSVGHELGCYFDVQLSITSLCPFLKKKKTG